MSQTLLKLVDPETEQGDTLSMERRRANRYSTSGRVTALQKPTESGETARICSLQLLNMSDTGMGTLSQDSIPMGSPITIFFPPHGPDRGFDLTGHVVRCTRRDQGHEIGIRLAAQSAAA